MHVPQVFILIDHLCSSMLLCILAQYCFILRFRFYILLYMRAFTHGSNSGNKMRPKNQTFWAKCGDKFSNIPCTLMPLFTNWSSELTPAATWTSAVFVPHTGSLPHSFHWLWKTQTARTRRRKNLRSLQLQRAVIVAVIQPSLLWPGENHNTHWNNVSTHYL